MLVFLLFGWVVARRIGRPARPRAWVPDRLRTILSRRALFALALVGTGVPEPAQAPRAGSSTPSWWRWARMPGRTLIALVVMRPEWTQQIS